MTDPQLPPEPGSARLVFTLGLAGLVSGLLLVGAYEATLPAIEHNRAEALRAAVFQVVPGAASMQKLVWRDDALRTADGSEKADAEAVYAAYDGEGGFLGYAIPGAGSGFQDTISLIYGYDPEEKRAIGMQVLESRETPGLGDKIFKDPHFVAEFGDLAMEPAVQVVKKGEGTAPNQVDGITGATISSKAVVRIVNEAHAKWRERLPATPPPREEAPK